MQLTKFKELWNVVNNFELDRISQTEIRIFSDTGLDTDFSDVFEIDGTLVTILKDGTVRKAIIYISEKPKWHFERWGENAYPKYHIEHCQEIRRMINNGKKDRYKKAHTKDGKFFMVISGGENERRKLEVCGYCLNEYNKENIHKFKKETFNILNYIKEPINNNNFNQLNDTYFKDDLETVPSFYAHNWNEISNELKKIKNYTCQKCAINLQDTKQYLHTHHVDSNPSNNVISNLKVLCIACHANEFNHSHIKSNSLYSNFIKIKDLLNQNDYAELHEKCPKCSSNLKYTLGVAKVKSQVRCSNCNHIFLHKYTKVLNES
jgi:5-methylcytosine-specific restriction endonuclease McrA